MDCAKTGLFIRTLRRQNGLTQQRLADILGVSDKAVSKWERGLGCPDLSLLPALAQTFSVTIENLLSGEPIRNDTERGNMKKLKFYICPICGNIITSTAETTVSCCGKILSALEAKKAQPDEKLNVELIENELFISSAHEMTKKHYISFAALLTGDCVIMRRLWPEWDMQTRIPRISRGILVWHCTKHGLFYQIV
ncbi:MAG: helix-turn-helix domain-containing protein [Clostridia bacterium]|nr:helix-turn-helix domain-containing protein [Clostridia bacterium]